MGLLNELQKNDKKGLFKNSDVFAHYSTGYLPIDYLNAFTVNYLDENGMMQQDIAPGIIGGRFMTIVGYSGSGKTTLADQIAWNILNDYHNDEQKKCFTENALLWHFDIEQTALRPRICAITNTKPDEPRISVVREHVSIEDVLEILDKICKAKEAGGDEFKYTIDGKWFGGKPVKVYVPTILILDSLPTFTSREVKSEELEGQMSTNREVGQISQFYSKCLFKMYKYNIMIIAINHIKTKLKINMYEPDKPQLMLLRDGESLPRGQAPIYLASSLFRLNASGAKANQYTVEDNGFAGFKAYLQVTKTKTSYIGGVTPLAFNEKIGYDPIYTLLEFAFDNGMIDGRQPYLYIKGAEAYKFSKKTFRNRFIDDEMFRLNFMNALKPALEALINKQAMNANDTNPIEYLSMNKLLTVNEKGELVPNGIVETKSGLVLKNAGESVTESGIVLPEGADTSNVKLTA